MSAEQQARDLLEACGVEDAQKFTAGDVVALANYISEHNRLEAELRSALSNLVDPDDCWYDHNGACQAHGFFDGECGHAMAKRLLAGTQ